MYLSSACSSTNCCDAGSYGTKHDNNRASSLLLLLDGFVAVVVAGIVPLLAPFVPRVVSLASVLLLAPVSPPALLVALPLPVPISTPWSSALLPLIDAACSALSSLAPQACNSNPRLATSATAAVNSLLVWTNDWMCCCTWFVMHMQWSSDRKG